MDTLYSLNNGEKHHTSICSFGAVFPPVCHDHTLSCLQGRRLARPVHRLACRRLWTPQGDSGGLSLAYAPHWSDTCTRDTTNAASAG